MLLILNIIVVVVFFIFLCKYNLHSDRRSTLFPTVFGPIYIPFSRLFLVLSMFPVPGCFSLFPNVLGHIYVACSRLFLVLSMFPVADCFWSYHSSLFPNVLGHIYVPYSRLFLVLSLFPVPKCSWPYPCFLFPVVFGPIYVPYSRTVFGPMSPGPSCSIINSTNSITKFGSPQRKRNENKRHCL